MNIVIKSDRIAQNPDSFWYSFNVKVDDVTYVCKISDEALSDMNPAYRNESAESRINANYDRLTGIISKKVPNSQKEIVITTEDLSA